MTSDQQLIELQKQSPKIYSGSLELTPQPEEGSTKAQGAFFKLFLINNKLSLPTEPYFIEWGTTNPKTLHEDVDTFIGTYITQKDKNGNHPSLREAGIFEHNYSNKAEYVKTAVDFYKNHGVAKIVDVYKPDQTMLEAAEKNPNLMLQYEAMAYTEDQEFIKYVNEMKSRNEDIYVSPGVFALDSKTEGKKIIVNRFIGTHSSIVDHPAHTKPIAFIKKEICNNDHKTCYFKLLTASEVISLNNNNSENNDMANTIPSSVADIGSPAPELVQTKTEVKDSKGNLIETINKNPEQQAQQAKQEVTKEKEQAVNEVKQEVEDGKKKLEEKEKKEEKKEEKSIDKLSKTEILELMQTWKQDTIKEIEERTEQKYKQVRRSEILNSFIPVTNEALKGEYEFYKALPISPDQLQQVLVNSKFNPEIQKALASSKSIKPFDKPNGDKPENMHTAGAVHNTAITSDRVKTTTYNDANTGFGTGVSNMRHLTSGKNIPKRYK